MELLSGSGSVVNSSQTLSLDVSPLHVNRLNISAGHVTDDWQVRVLRAANGMKPVTALNCTLTARAADTCEEPMVEAVSVKTEKTSTVLRLTDVAEMVHDDWQLLATQLHASDTHIDRIRAQYHYPSEQVPRPL